MGRKICLLSLCFLLILSLFLLTACDETVAIDEDEEPVILNEETEETESDDCREIYDDHGNLTRLEWLDENGNAEYAEVYEYNENDRCTAMFIYEDGALSYALRYEYDGYRCLCVKYYDETDTLMNIDQYIYDEDEMVCGIDSYFYMGDYRYHLIRYDAAMNMLYEELYDENGVITNWIQYEYEDALCVKGMEADGHYTVYLYDEEGEQIGYQYYDPSDELLEEVYYE